MGWGKYCSQSCAVKDRPKPPSTKIERHCEACGTAFLVYPSVIKFGTARFCSPACARKPRGRTYVDSTCEQCGITFRIEQWKVRQGGGKFCSRSCLGKSRIGERNPSFGTGTKRVEAKCAHCDKTFRFYPRGDKGAGTYCSRRCYHEANSGKSSALYRGGRYDAAKRFYQSQEWKDLSAQCKERDGHICQECQQAFPSRRLHAHHLIERRDGGTDTLDNLITLCLSCHRRHHTVLGHMRRIARLSG